jgi:uncharacterized phage protein (predicted DNA packaging)
MADNVVKVPDVGNMMNLDIDDSDTLMSAYIDAAEQYVKNAVGTDIATFYTDDSTSVPALFKVAVMSLAGTYYQYRIAMSDTQTYDIDLTLNSIIGQLRGLYAQAYEEVHPDDQTNSTKPIL